MITRAKPKNKSKPEGPPPFPSAPDPADVRLLRWYLEGDYVGDVGLRSALGRQLDEAQLVRGSEAPMEVVRDVSYDPTDDLLAAASRLKLVERRFRRLTTKHQSILRLLYGLAPHPLPSWGRVGILVVNLRSAVRAWNTSKTDKPLPDWLTNLRKRPESANLVNALRREAEALEAEAVRAWEATGGRRA